MKTKTKPKTGDATDRMNALVRCLFIRAGWGRAHTKRRLGLQQKEEYLWRKYQIANLRVGDAMKALDGAND